MNQHNLLIITSMDLDKMYYIPLVNQKDWCQTSSACKPTPSILNMLCVCQKKKSYATYEDDEEQPMQSLKLDKILISGYSYL